MSWRGEERRGGPIQSSPVQIISESRRRGILSFFFRQVEADILRSMILGKDGGRSKGWTGFAK